MLDKISENINLIESAEKKVRENNFFYSYPYNGLIENLKCLGIKKLPLFVFGSLVSKEDAARTLGPDSLATRKPAVAFAVVRLFNRDVPIKAGSKWGTPCLENARGMLNIVKTSNVLDVVNGVVMEVDIHDLPRLLEREEGYDLIPILVTDWSAFHKKNTFVFSCAYTFHAKGEYVSNLILPRPGYYEFTRDAIKDFGEDFYQIWLDTTFLSDGKTSARQWEETTIKNNTKPHK